MGEPQTVLLALGVLLLGGLLTDVLGRRTPLPRVTLLLLFGVAAGPYGLNWLPTSMTDNFDLVAEMALLMVGFLLGEKFTPERLRAAGRGVGAIVLSEGLMTALLVLAGLVLIGVPLVAAIPLACIAAASAPAATVDVIMEERAAGPFTDKLVAIVALDDGLGLLLFSFGLGVATAIVGTAMEVSPLMFVLHELGGALLLGAALGIPGAYLTGRLDPGQPTLVEALGLVFLCGGLALTLEVSFLIASMTMGAVIANLARHHERPFHAIEDIEWPFMILFFALAGAELEIPALREIGLVGLVYVVCRFCGKVLGTKLGSIVSGTDGMVRRWMGYALLPQAGVAMGMALVAINQLPEYRHIILPIVIGTTVLFELIGPVFTRLALRRAGESSRE